MSFYAPENFTDPVQIAYEKEHRILQPIWDFLKNGREDTLRSPLFPPVLAVSFYFIVCGIFTIFDLYGHKIKSLHNFLLRHKIQPHKQVTWAMMKNCLINLIYNHLVYIMPVALVQLIWTPPTPLPEVAPTLWAFCWQQFLWFFMFDAYYWAYHALHHKALVAGTTAPYAWMLEMETGLGDHIRPLYRWFHSVHHQYHSPFAMMTQYLHPMELVYVGTGITVIPWITKPHILTYWSWFIVSSWVSIEVHTGYEIPFAAHKWCWIYGGAPKHDMHHQRPQSNYEPWLTYLDWIFNWNLKAEDIKGLKYKMAGEQHPDDEKVRKKFN